MADIEHTGIEPPRDVEVYFYSEDSPKNFKVTAVASIDPNGNNIGLFDGEDLVFVVPRENLKYIILSKPIEVTEVIEEEVRH